MIENEHFVIMVTLRYLPPIILTYWVYRPKAIIECDGQTFNIDYFKPTAPPNKLKKVCGEHYKEGFEYYLSLELNKRIRKWTRKHQPNKHTKLSREELVQYWHERFATHGKYL